MNNIERPGKPVFRHGKRIETIELVSSSVRQKRHRKDFKAKFVQVPMQWIEALSQAKNPGTYQLAMALLAERHKRQHIGGEVVISAGTVPGMLRMARWRATKELVALGLIEVDRTTNHGAARVRAFLD